MSTRKRKRGRPVGTTRPPKPTSKQKTIALRVGAEAEAEIKRQAKAEGIAVSEWVWQAILARFARGVVKP